MQVISGKILDRIIKKIGASETAETQGFGVYLLNHFTSHKLHSNNISTIQLLAEIHIAYWDFNQALEEELLRSRGKNEMFIPLTCRWAEFGKAHEQIEKLIQSALNDLPSSFTDEFMQLLECSKAFNC